MGDWIGRLVGENMEREDEMKLLSQQKKKSTKPRYNFAKVESLLFQNEGTFNIILQKF